MCMLWKWWKVLKSFTIQHFGEAFLATKLFVKGKFVISFFVSDSIHFLNYAKLQGSKSDCWTFALREAKNTPANMFFNFFDSFCFNTIHSKALSWTNLITCISLLLILLFQQCVRHKIVHTYSNLGFRESYQPIDNTLGSDLWCSSTNFLG